MNKIKSMQCKSCYTQGCRDISRYAIYRDIFIYRDMRYIAIFFGHIAIQTDMDIRR